MSKIERGVIKNLLKEYDEQEVDVFASYCVKLLLARKKDKSLRNPWMQKKTSEQMAELFKRVKKQGLTFDGVHITLQYTGVCFDYQAYKNKMYIAYPESKIDIQLVRDGDDFSFEKKSGKVIYTHKMKETFSGKEVVGVYCVIKNRRGEFFLPLSKQDILKRRKKAKTDSIWKEWPEEMIMKTVIKRACNLHFNDVIQGVEEMDNENYDLENPIDLDLEWKQEIESFDDLEKFRLYFKQNKGRGKEFQAYAIKHAEKLKQQKNEDSQNGTAN